ncbi:MAG: hypothetical protein A2672_02870 [Candidatus Wildermuthbacteria bacterium RIFCSPHIGHO2_01_FULL_49_22b]|uniref:Uncharacterized protein n=1 Tax=Candidatus Wildermuthbacteria bacterium RIFCSPHIGHO2_01_FULL_49_22b TaxID=1802448 RepID=A0A1G2QVZ7_9BACT|nr:MAG: hypothetical protein A2672_02870 [Candidatus Wildermuthbacteria bacterium RIFCSPHIGHO2_01_FULL_49_22b]
MKKYFSLTILVFIFSLAFLTLSSAQNNHTARQEAEGKVVWEALQEKQRTCADLSTEDFGALGEYFMGQMMGDSHEAMNIMMIQAMGQEGEEQAHIAMGKRMSNCEPNAPLPQSMMSGGMMSMMMGNGTTGGFGWGMMPWSFGLGAGLLWMLYVVWLVAGVLAVIWLYKNIVKK